MPHALPLAVTVIAVAALVGVPASPGVTRMPPPGAELFSDDFESHDLAKWKTAVDMEVQRQEVHAGSWAARQTSSGNPTYARATLSTAQTDVTYSLWIEPLALETTVTLLQLRTSTANLVSVNLTPSGAISYKNGVDGTVVVSSTKLTTGQWYELSVHAVVQGVTSMLEITVDASLVKDLTGPLNLGSDPVSVIQLGNNSADRAYEVAMDDVVVTGGEAPPSDPVVAGAGDISCGAVRIPDDFCQDQATSDLLVAGAYDKVLALGDNQYETGALTDFESFYDPTWGRVKDITSPSAGNHEYLTPGAAGYFAYFGAAAGDPDEGYYSYDIGAWHVIVLNSNCGKVGGCSGGRPRTCGSRPTWPPMTTCAPWPTGTTRGSPRAPTAATPPPPHCGRTSMPREWTWS